jgi:hypothetical protein
MDKREFLKTSAAGALALVAARYLHLPLIPCGEVQAHELTGTSFEFSAREALLEMVDQTLVYHWAWQAGHEFPSIAGPTLILELNVPVTVTVHNTLDEPHGWAVTDRAGGFQANTGPIAPGGVAQITFTPVNPGTFLYLDPENAPVNRVMGLFGGVVVKPVAPAAPNKVTPYSGGALPVPGNIQRLFNDFGSTAHFPGEAWDPNNWNLWLFGSVDPSKNMLVQQLGPGQTIARADFVNNYTPRYFHINGRQGFFSAHDAPHENHAGTATDHGVMLSSPAGRPRLIRNINVGLSAHSPHVHANHGFVLFEGTGEGIRRNLGIQDNVLWLDSWTMKPMAHKDVLYPFIKPPDIPDETWQRLKNGTSEEGFPDNPFHQDDNGVFRPGFPLRYPMHCHLELSQSAGGGSYPQGMIADIEFTGAVGGA